MLSAGELSVDVPGAPTYVDLDICEGGCLYSKGLYSPEPSIPARNDTWIADVHSVDNG